MGCPAAKWWSRCSAHGAVIRIEVRPATAGAGFDRRTKKRTAAGERVLVKTRQAVAEDLAHYMERRG